MYFLERPKSITLEILLLTLEMKYDTILFVGHARMIFVDKREAAPVMETAFLF
jgi:hypothetical protein